MTSLHRYVINIHYFTMYVDAERIIVDVLIYIQNEILDP